MRSVMARLTWSRGSSSSTKRSPSRVAQEGAVATQRLGEERPGHGRVVQRGRVELHELDVGDGHPGPQRHGDAVAGGLDRVRRDGVELAGAAGGEQDVTGADLDRRSPSRADGDHARAAAVARTIRSRAKVRSSTRGGGLPHGGDEGPLDLEPGGGAAGVDDAGDGVAALPGPRAARRGRRRRTRHRGR